MTTTIRRNEIAVMVGAMVAVAFVGYGASITLRAAVTIMYGIYKSVAG